MNFKRTRLIIIALVFMFIFFFSSDFGLIDVEKTSIITAFAIDKEQNGGYTVSAQIAVPEATDTNSENQKALLTGKGSTIGGAIKDLGDVSGWYPKLSFCNLIIIGEDFADTDVISCLDYFAKTLRIQDSAQVTFADGKASDLLKEASPLDNISSFAIQKVLLKASGFDSDIASTDIKSFCSGYYSKDGSSIMPLIKLVPSDEKQSQSSNSSSQSSGGSSSKGSSSEGQTKTNVKFLFNAKTTALFKKGIKVGELSEPLTLTYNMLTKAVDGTTFPVDNVECEYGQDCNFLLRIVSTKRKVYLTVDNNGPTLNVSLKIYCRIDDQNAPTPDDTFSENKPLPTTLIEKAQNLIESQINELIETSIQTECDFLKVKEKLYRYNIKQYSRFKDNVLTAMDKNVKVIVSGQK